MSGEAIIASNLCPLRLTVEEMQSADIHVTHFEKGFSFTAQTDTKFIASICGVCKWARLGREVQSFGKTVICNDP